MCRHRAVCGRHCVRGIKCEIGAMVTVLCGLDLLVNTAGVGERSVKLRKRGLPRPGLFQYCAG